MRIQSIKISGFRNLKDVFIQLEDITALIGINNFGKSNVLDGIDYMVQLIKGSKETKVALLSLKSNMPLNKDNFGEDLSFEMNAQTCFDGTLTEIVYSLKGKWKMLKEDQPAILQEHLKVRDVGKGGQWSNLIHRVDNVAKYKRNPSGRCSYELKVKENELALNKLADRDEYHYSDLIRKINGLRIYTENTIDADTFYTPDILFYKGKSGDVLEYENLPRVLHEIESSDSRQWEILQDMIKILFPNIQELIVKKLNLNGHEKFNISEDVPFAFNEEIYRLYVKDDNIGEYPLDISQMSVGMKRILLILTRIIVAVKNNVSLILLEEPEDSIHPGLLNAFLQMLADLQEDCKILLTSHSPLLIEYLKLNQIRLGYSVKPGLATFGKLSKRGENRLLNDSSQFHTAISQEIFSVLEDSPEIMEMYLQ